MSHLTISNPIDYSVDDFVLEFANMSAKELALAFNELDDNLVDRAEMAVVELFHQQNKKCAPSEIFELFLNTVYVVVENKEHYSACLTIAYIESGNLNHFVEEVKDAFEDERFIQNYFYNDIDRSFYNALPKVVEINRMITNEEYENESFGVNWNIFQECTEAMSPKQFISSTQDDYAQIPVILSVFKKNIRTIITKNNKQEVIYLH